MSTQKLTTGSYFQIDFEVDGSKDSEISRILNSTFNTVKIVNRLDNHMPLVYITFKIDNQAFIENNFYPDRNFKMYIYYSDEDNSKYGDPLIMDLLILEMNIDLPQKYMYNITDKWEVIHRDCMITCVPKRAHEILNCTVNKMWWDPKTVWNCVNEVIDELKINPKKVEDEKSNKKVVPQLLIPPMSFQNLLKYMDEKYGIYDDKLFFYVYYSGAFYMWGLKSKFSKEKIYTVHKFPSYTKTEAAYQEPSKLARTTANNYVTYNDFKTICITNDPFIDNGGMQYHIFHPKYDISQIKTFDPIGKAESDGIHSNKKDLKVDSSTLKRRIVVMDRTISDEDCKNSDTSMLANYIDPAYKMNFLYFRIIRKIKPHYLMRIGEPIEIKMYAESEKYSPANYEGKYLICESEFKITREQGEQFGHDTFYGTCDVVCCRTSQSNN